MQGFPFAWEALVTGKETLATEYQVFGGEHGWAPAKILISRSFQTPLKLVLSIFLGEEIDTKTLKTMTEVKESC